MIAVFCEMEREFFDLLNPTPRKVFKRIKGVRDIRGERFTGIITVKGWDFAGNDIQDAYEALKIRQPDLFKPY